MAINRKQTGPEVMQLASRILRDDRSSNIDKKLAASLIAQSSTNKETSQQMAVLASEVMRGPDYSAQSKSLAASLLAQARKG